MADLVIAKASVLADGDVKQETVTAGAAITAGQALYRDATDADKYKLARANAAATARCDGIALCDAASGQPLVVARPTGGGRINLGATLAVGETYVVSAAVAGAIAPIGDLTSAQHPVIIGGGESASKLKFGHADHGVAKA